MTCHICGHTTTPFAIAQVLGRHAVRYFRCEICGFMQTEAPYWLAEAYAQAITKKDLGLAGRNIVFATLCRAMIPVFFNANAKFVDYGGGVRA
jgi:hypothetical protein